MCGIVGKSQPYLIVITPMISPRTLESRRLIMMP
eukprot:COSAG01_NODE_4327_length_5128_cov_23.227833_2_plen_34_part_00